MKLFFGVLGFILVLCYGTTNKPDISGELLGIGFLLLANLF